METKILICKRSGCGKPVEVGKMANNAVCKDCREKELIARNTKTCKNGHTFVKRLHNVACPICKEEERKRKECIDKTLKCKRQGCHNLVTVSKAASGVICSECKENDRIAHSTKTCKNGHVFKRTYYKSSCPICKEEEKKRGKRVCPECNIEKQMPTEIYNFGMCYDCINKKKEEKLQQKLNNDEKHWRKCSGPCGKDFLVVKMKTVFICDECKAKRKERTCEKCGHVYQTSRKFGCPKCKEEKQKEYEKRKTICLHCKQWLERSKFDGRESICIECKEKKRAEREAEINKNEYERPCKECGKIKIVSKRTTIFVCKECREKQKQERLNKVFTRECKNPLCKKTFETTNHRITFSYCPDCKAKRDEMKRQNIINYLTQPRQRTCSQCNEKIEVNDLHAPTNIKCEKCIADPARRSGNEYMRHCAICYEEVLVDQQMITYVKCEKHKDTKLELIKKDENI